MVGDGMVTQWSPGLPHLEVLEMPRAPRETAPRALTFIDCSDPLVSADVADLLICDSSHPAVTASAWDGGGGGGGLAVAHQTSGAFTVLLGPRVHKIANLFLKT